MRGEPSLNSPNDVAVSSDGRSVYVATGEKGSSLDGAIGVLGSFPQSDYRHAHPERLHGQSGAGMPCASASGVGGSSGLDVRYRYGLAVDVSPDGSSVYLTSGREVGPGLTPATRESQGYIAHFSRSSSGSLTYIGCYQSPGGGQPCHQRGSAGSAAGGKGFC